MTKRKHWTEAENLELIKGLKAGKTFEEIGAELNRVENGVKQQYYLLKRIGKIKFAIPKQYRNAKKIMIKETGKKFDTMREAGKYFECSAPTIKNRVKDGKVIYDPKGKEYHLTLTD